MEIEIKDLKDKIPSLRIGDRVLLSGTVYTMRDAAHKKIMEMLKDNQPLPFDLCGAVLYYAGPTPAKPGEIVGSFGPTTSGRMDSFTPTLLSNGLLAMIGKGKRSFAVKESMKNHGAVYFAAIGGAGALCAKAVESCEEIALLELGCESIKKVALKNFPVIVAIDSLGNDIYEVKEDKIS